MESNPTTQKVIFYDSSNSIKIPMDLAEQYLKAANAEYKKVHGLTITEMEFKEKLNRNN